MQAGFLDFNPASALVQLCDLEHSASLSFGVLL